MRKPNNIQQIMDNKKITYRQLSKMTGVSWSALHKIANYERSPTQDTMISIAKGLNMKVSEVSIWNTNVEAQNGKNIL